MPHATWPARLGPEDPLAGRCQLLWHAACERLQRMEFMSGTGSCNCTQCRCHGCCCCCYRWHCSQRGVGDLNGSRTSRVGHTSFNFSKLWKQQQQKVENSVAKQTKHVHIVVAAVRLVLLVRPVLAACGASPFATPSATRIGYVECPFNGLYTLTLTQRVASFHQTFYAALVFRAVWLPWIAAAWFSSFSASFHFS